MSFKILYVAATESEAAVLRNIKGIDSAGSGYRIDDLEINVLITGIGALPTSWSITNWVAINGKPDLAVNGGIAGSFNELLKTGDIVMPMTDCFADSGIEDNDKFQTLFEAGLSDPDEFPYKGGILHSDQHYTEKLRERVIPVKAITTNTATGSDVTLKRLISKYNPGIETLEGASFFYICIRERIPFFAVRAISNKVEPRNRQNWNIPLALERLSLKLEEIFLTLG